MIEIIKYAKRFLLQVIGRVEETFRAIFLNSYIVYNLSRVVIYVTSITSNKIIENKLNILFLVEKSLARINYLLDCLLVCPHFTDWSKKNVKINGAILHKT